MTTLFVVTENEFSYNDEVYYLEGEGGRPVAGFYTEEEANNHARKLTHEWLQDAQLGEYGYGIDEILSDKPSFLSDSEWDKFSDDPYFAGESVLSMKERTDQQINEVAELLEFQPFSVYSVTVE